MTGVISACILAGGLSSRMGREKARLRLGGRSLLAHVRAAAHEAGLAVRVIRRDAVPRCGPLGGVYTALHGTQSEAILFLSCDMPFVTADLMRRVIDQLGPSTQAVFTATDRCLGFPFLLRRQTLTTVEDLLAVRQFSLQALGRKLKAVVVTLPQAQRPALLNINTPGDLEAARRRTSRTR
jgi:molybdopterin-guanine dinucleotide biosynthesis protein A